jgi:kynureninase
MGLQIPDAYATSFFGSSMPWGMDCQLGEHNCEIIEPRPHRFKKMKNKKLAEASIQRSALCDLDRADPLATLRDQFLIPDNLLYMNGNSLGPLTALAQEKLSQAVSDEWGKKLIRGWNTAGWYDLPWRLGDKIGQLIGAEPGETVVCDSTSVNLFKAVAAALSLQSGRTKIVSEAGNFPTDLYVLDGLSRFTQDKYEVDIRARSDVINAINADTAVVVLTHVHYVSAEIFPMAEITQIAHDAGALVVWDLSHSIGAIATDLTASNADFAVGCGYKHLNGGPGAPAFIYAANRHHAAMRQPLSGWFGHANPFEFTDDFTPAGDIRRLLCGTTGVLGATGLEAGVDVMLTADRDAMFEKSKALSNLFQQLIEECSVGEVLEIRSPLIAAERGAHISYAHESGYAIMQNLVERGVIGDFRAPDNIRFGFSPLFMRYTDVYDVVEILEDILTSRTYEDDKYVATHSVT